MVLVPRAGALHEGHVLGLLAVGRPDDLAAGGPSLRGQPLHHHVGDHVRALPEAQVVELGGIVGSPAGGHDDGADLDLDLLLRHVRDRSRPGGQTLRERRRRRHSDSASRSRTWNGRIGHVVRQVERLGLVHPEVEIVGPLGGQLLRRRTRRGHACPSRTAAGS